MNALTMKKVGETELLIVRRFDAPPEAVYKAHVDEALLKQWMLGPEGWSMPNCRIDARPGGAFAYTWQSEDGERFTIRGTFLELDPPHRILHEETMDMGEDEMPASQVTTEFKPDGAGTRMEMTIRYDSAEAREAAVASGMEEGMAVSYDNLARMVA